ncbi:MULTISPECIES: hypothetical protein [unclassified Sulfitobacter]|nr:MULTISPECIES: hypothetical protein [unclassified Sulfitobacter]
MSYSLLIGQVDVHRQPPIPPPERQADGPASERVPAKVAFGYPRRVTHA